MMLIDCGLEHVVGEVSIEEVGGVRTGVIEMQGSANAVVAHGEYSLTQISVLVD
jgi:hypothetical protein